MHKELRTYRTRDGKEPFTDWLLTLKDRVTRVQIRNRVNRISLGNYGDYKSIGEGVYELRISYGPGYRVYFAEQTNTIVLLLIGGDKSSQEKDIAKAKQYWKDIKGRIYD
jgi:putative addiction module killer protein